MKSQFKKLQIQFFYEIYEFLQTFVSYMIFIFSRTFIFLSRILEIYID